MKIVTIDIPDNKTEKLFKEFASENGIKILTPKIGKETKRASNKNNIPNLVTRKVIADIESGKTKRVDSVEDLMTKILS